MNLLDRTHYLLTQYNEHHESKTRREAGRQLGYSPLRIQFHELKMRLPYYPEAILNQMSRPLVVLRNLLLGAEKAE